MPQSIWKAAWFALAGVYIFLVAALIVKLPFAGAIPGLLALHVLAYDPGWISPMKAEGPERVFYDGYCGLCHGAVRFLLAEDRTGAAFRFAPLQSSAFEAELPEAKRASLPDSMVVVTEHKRVLARSAAVLHIGRRLGGFWGSLARAAANLPAGMLDGLYDIVAKTRHRLFQQPEEACPIVPEAFRARFDA